MLRIFTPVKIQRLRSGLNPRTWVPEASMLTTRPPIPSSLLRAFAYAKQSQYKDRRKIREERLLKNFRILFVQL